MTTQAPVIALHELEERFAANEAMLVESSIKYGDVQKFIANRKVFGSAGRLWTDCMNVNKTKFETCLNKFITLNVLTIHGNGILDLGRLAELIHKGCNHHLAS